MRVRMSSFTCTLTGGSQFAICNLRNLREHFFSESRMKLTSILPSVRNVYGAKLYEHFLANSGLRKYREKPLLPILNLLTHSKMSYWIC